MFLEEEDHSRVCPGKKDCITIGKIKNQKMLLQVDLNDLHKAFLKTYYEISYVCLHGPVVASSPCPYYIILVIYFLSK